jgi:hypothetical protein
MSSADSRAEGGYFVSAWRVPSRICRQQTARGTKQTRYFARIGMSVAIRLTVEMRVRLTRKLAEAIDGVDLSGHSVGETFDLPRRDARLLIAEGWAQPDLRGHGSSVVIAFRRATDPGPLHRDEDELSRAS